MKMYIYNQDTNEIAAIITGETNEACEAEAEELDYDQDIYAWTYAPNNELFQTTETNEFSVSD